MALQHKNLKNQTKENKPKEDHTFVAISAIRPMSVQPLGEFSWINGLSKRKILQRYAC